MRSHVFVQKRENLTKTGNFEGKGGKAAGKVSLPGGWQGIRTYSGLSTGVVTLIVIAVEQKSWRWRGRGPMHVHWRSAGGRLDVVLAHRQVAGQRNIRRPVLLLGTGRR